MHVHREKAEQMRSEGYSYNLISQKLNISKGTLSYWFKGKPFTPNQQVIDRTRTAFLNNSVNKHNTMMKEIEDMKQLGIADIGILSERDLMLLGVGLYIGEGAKTTNEIRISNSDPRVIRLGISWLKTIGLEINNIGLAIHIYPDNDPDKSKQHWLKETGLAESNFRWISVDRRTNKSPNFARKLPHGTAHLSVMTHGDKEKGARLFRRLNGWMTGALNQV